MGIKPKTSQTKVSTFPKKKVCFIAFTDYGNSMTNWSRAIDQFSEGLESRSICIRPHHFSYGLSHDIDLTFPPEAGGGEYLINVEGRDKAIEWLLGSSHIVLAEEIQLEKKPLRYQTLGYLRKILNFCLLELKLANPKLNLYIHHCGIDYRVAHHQFDQLDLRYFDKVLMGVDLYRLCPGTPQYLVPVCAYQAPLSADKVEESIHQKFSLDEIRISHTPSSHSDKGTEIIRNVVREVFERVTPKTSLKLSYEEVNPPVPNARIIELKKKSHIHIDQFSSEVGGYGISSVEALSLGNIVLSSIQNISERDLELQCGSTELKARFPIINTQAIPSVLSQALENLLLASKEKRLDLALESHGFFQDLMSYPAVARRFEKKIFQEAT